MGALCFASRLTRRIRLEPDPRPPLLLCRFGVSICNFCMIRRPPRDDSVSSTRLFKRGEIGYFWGVPTCGWQRRTGWRSRKSPVRPGGALRPAGRCSRKSAIAPSFGSRKQVGTGEIFRWNRARSDRKNRRHGGRRNCRPDRRRNCRRGNSTRDCSRSWNSGEHREAPRTATADMRP